MKKLAMMWTLLGLLLLAGCGESEKQDHSVESEENLKKVKGTVLAEEFDQMYSDPAKYKNYEVTFTGRVFVEPERDADGVYLQIWADPVNHEKNMIVAYDDPQFSVKTDDYLLIKGIVKKEYKGENAFGATLTMPVIEATSIELVDYITAVAPSIKTVEINEELNQNGYIVQLQKIEFAETQTRAYVKVKNNTKNKISFYTHNSKLLVGSQQYEEEYIYEADFPEIHSDLLVGAETEGIIAYPAIDSNLTSLQFYAEGYSDDYNIRIDPFVFEVTIP